MSVCHTQSTGALAKSKLIRFLQFHSTPVLVRLESRQRTYHTVGGERDIHGATKGFGEDCDIKLSVRLEKLGGNEGEGKATQQKRGDNKAL